MPITGALAKKVKVFDYGRRYAIVFIPCLYPSENKILSMHPMARKRAHDRFQQAAGLIMKARKIRPFETPVRILIDLCFKKKRRRDNDNYTGKWLIDAIVKAGILPDDSTRWIPEAPDIKIIDGEPEDQIALKIEEV